MKNQELHPRTAVINKKQKLQAKHLKQDALTWLSVQFPEAFDNTTSIRPLKIGIMEDILKYAELAEQSGISKSKLRQAVVIYTRRIDYLTCLKAREMRIDLLGEPIEAVSEEDAAKAALKIKKRVEKSAKNARKATPVTKPAYAYPPKQEPAHLTYHSDRGERSDHHHLGAQQQNPSPVRTASVIVKHKVTRQYDPVAVARLKERLGLAKKAETVE